MRLDATDRLILAALVRDGRMRLRALAMTLRLGQSAVGVRLARLQRIGVLAGFGARLDATRLGRPMQALVRVRLQPGTDRSTFENRLRGTAGVLAVWQLTGDVDYEIRLACADLVELDAVVGCLRARGGAEYTSTCLLLREVPGFDSGSLLLDRPLSQVEGAADVADAMVGTDTNGAASRRVSTPEE